MADAANQSQSMVNLADPGRFQAFYAEALPRVYGYFLHRCGGHAALAEDLTQETFMAAVAVIKRGTPVAVPVPWVLGIARHKLIDHFRRQRHAGWTLVSWEEDAGRIDEAGESTLPGDEPISHERVIAALGRVASTQREVLVLRYLDGLPVADVAALTGRSVGAVESLLTRGRAGFRRAYVEAGDG